MVQSGGMSVVKYLLFIFNFIFVVCGIAIIVVGSLAINTPKDFGIDVSGQYVAGPILIIVIGSIIFLIAFLGCCGAIQESQCMLITFAVLIGLIFIIELAGGIAAVVYKKEVRKFVQDEVKLNISDSKLLEKMQKKLQCCGVKGSEDYFDRPIPPTCCSEVPDICTKTDAYKQGCLDALAAYLEKNIEIAGGVAIGLAFVELIGIIFACCLAKEIKNEHGIA